MTKPRVITDPWERQMNETVKAWRAFVIFRDLGADRSLSKVAKQVGISDNMVGRWYKANNWVERADAWLAHLDEVRRTSTIEEVRAMAQRHAELAMGILQLAAERLETLNPKTINARTLAALVDTGVKVERLARGVSTERSEVAITDTVAVADRELMVRAMSDPRTRDLALELVERLAGGTLEALPEPIEVEAEEVVDPTSEDPDEVDRFFVGGGDETR